MTNIRNIFIAILAGFLGSVGYNYFFAPSTSALEISSSRSKEEIASPVNYFPEDIKVYDLSYAAEQTTPSVVYIETISRHYSGERDFWDFFFYRGPVQGAGSGVIISENGYIVTNNHVIDKADKITVFLHNRKKYEAKVIGRDPSTDIALLKIEARNLTPIKMGNSDELKIGQWVLAVGNPMNLRYTVTAGIVSAKGRNINIVHGKFPIESFIQTDAAINPGNSGGALVNAYGELVGINTAIASRTGNYIGYGFAIPVNIVKKIVKDFIDFGNVQRAFLGVEVVDLDDKVVEKMKLEDYHGVLVYDVIPGSVAEKAGIKPGDILLKIANYPVNSKAEYLERLSYYRPGERISIIFKRDGKTKTANVTLMNEEGTTELLKKNSVFSEALGAEFQPVSKLEKNRLGIEQGFRVQNIQGGIMYRMGIPEGFIITAINRYKPKDVKELVKILENAQGQIIIEGVHPNGARLYYSFYGY